MAYAYPQDEPARQRPSDLVPLDEISIKTEYALKIQKRIQQSAFDGEDFLLNNVHLAMFWSAPLSAFLDGGRFSTTSVSATTLHEYLEAVPSMVKHCEYLCSFIYHYSKGN